MTFTARKCWLAITVHILHFKKFHEPLRQPSLCSWHARFQSEAHLLKYLAKTLLQELQVSECEADVVRKYQQTKVVTTGMVRFLP